MTKASIVLSMALLSAACAARSPVDYAPTNTPPRSPIPRSADQVTILRADAIERPFTEIGLLESLHDQDTPAQTMDRSLRERAAIIGCDAVVLLGDNEWIYRVVESGSTLTTRRRQGYRAVCIVYR